MRGVAFALLLIVLIGFAIAVATVVFHLRKYAVPGDKTRFVLRTFLIGTGIFCMSTLILFLTVPWDNLNLPALFT